MVDRALFLRDAGYSVLLIDFQATGESPGDVITFGWRERLDVLAAVDFLRRALPGGVGAETCGRSITPRAWPARSSSSAE
jgi:alpha/beta superfamily hydrolase